ncbi:hypothetical protein [Alteromonas antoniana]|uniref:hypothetical protein n=1 Tax=Alteromonas antoniana TaxID=2803813 RepID=UPI001C43F8FD|nr:hypothetical protein [Alteromonas antoniana]
MTEPKSAKSRIESVWFFLAAIGASFAAGVFFDDLLSANNSASEKVIETKDTDKIERLEAENTRLKIQIRDLEKTDSWPGVSEKPTLAKNITYPNDCVVLEQLLDFIEAINPEDHLSNNIIAQPEGKLLEDWRYYRNWVEQNSAPFEGSLNYLFDALHGESVNYPSCDGKSRAGCFRTLRERIQMEAYNYKFKSCSDN